MGIKAKIYEHKTTKQLFLYIPRKKFKTLLNKKAPKFLEIKEENLIW